LRRAALVNDITAFGRERVSVGAAKTLGSIRMRHATLVTLMMILAGTTAFAKGKDDDAGKKSGTSMDSGDPAATETSDKPKSEEGENGEKGEKGKAKAEGEGEAGAEETVEVVIPARARDKLSLFADILIGFGQAPVPGPSLNTAGPGYTGKGTVFTFMAGGRYDITPKVSLGLRVPYTFGSERLQFVAAGNGKTVRGNALGAPELMVEYRMELNPRLRVPLMFGVGIPVAQGTASAYTNNTGTNDAAKSLQRRLQYLADAASGWKDEELFDPKRIPFVVAGGLDYERKAFQAHAGIKLILSIATSGAPNVASTAAYDATGQLKFNSTAFREVTSAGLSYDVPVSPKVTLIPAADAWLVWKAINTLEYTSTAVPPARVQFVFEPRIGASFSKNPKITPSLGYIFPIGGQLSTGKMGALELHADFNF
jgi:hypothetical protein